MSKSMSMSMQKKEAAAKVVSSACGTVRQTWRDPRDDLRKEREQTEVDVKQLEDVLAQGGRKGLERVKRLIALVKDTTWGTKEDRYFLTRDQLHKRGLRVALGIRDVVKREGLSFDDAMVLRKLVDLPGGFELHFGMFIPTLIGQGTPEQVNKWLKPSLACKIIGTYAQTEMVSAGIRKKKEGRRRNSVLVSHLHFLFFLFFFFFFFFFFYSEELVFLIPVFLLLQSKVLTVVCDVSFLYY